MTDVQTRLTAALADHYTVDRELGAGGMATVYLAHDIKHGRDVAIKVLHPDLGAALGGERFLSEIRTTARLQHPHILPLLDSGVADGLLYYVMPLVTGETLRSRLQRERQLPIADAVRIAREVASALDYAHRQNVIHRDIKPENILLHDGSALVADFGIALAVQQAGGQRMTQTGLSLGTPQYMSPEQAMGERAIDARSDVYALAAVTYEMLTGDPPFTGSSVQAVVAKVLSAEPERLTLTRKTIPLAIERAVLTGLAKLPADRQTTAAEFGAALRDAAPDNVDASNSIASVSDARGATRGVPWLVGVAGIAVGMAVMAAVLWPRDRSNGVGGDFTRAQMTFTGRAAFPAITPNGDVMAYVERNCEQPGHDAFAQRFGVGIDAVPCSSTLIVQDTGSSTPVRVIQGVPSISNVRWLASGTGLVVAAMLDSLRNGVFVIPRLGGTARRIGAQGLYDVHSAGDTVLLLTQPSASGRYAQVIVAATGAVTDSVAVPRPNLAGLSWSPDGRFIALTNSRQIVLVRRDGTPVDSLAVSGRDWLRWAPDGLALFVFKPAPARDDEFVRIEVNRDGHFGGAARSVMPRVPTLYRGEFDIAARTGQLLFISGDALQDLWIFSTGNAAEAPRQVTMGTSWYGEPVLAPDGRALFFVRGNSAGDNLYRLALDSVRAFDDAVTNNNGTANGVIEVSLDGRRLLFIKKERDTSFLYDVGVRERGIRRRVPFLQRRGVAPLPRGEREIVFLRTEGDGLTIAGESPGSTRELMAPDSIKLYAAALSPDEKEVVVMANIPGGSMIGAVTLDTWRIRLLARFPRPAWYTRVTWSRDGFIYFAEWQTSEAAPALFRVSGSSGGTPQRVMTLPQRCTISTVIVATSFPRGTCLSEDFRGDVYLATIPALRR